MRRVQYRMVAERCTGHPPVTTLGAQHRVFSRWLEENPPAHEYGFTPDQVDALVGDRREAFNQWMDGQTMALNDDGESIVYPHDLYAFLTGAPNLD